MQTPERKKQYQKDYSAKHRVDLNTYGREHSAMLRSAISTWKLARGCADCGYNKIPEALEFDHITDDKVLDVASMASRRVARERLVDEMDKCDVVCANCHRERTIRRLDADRGTR